MSATSDQILRENGKDPNWTIQGGSVVRRDTHTNTPQVDYTPLLWFTGAAIVLGLLITIVVLLVNLNKKSTASK